VYFKNTQEIHMAVGSTISRVVKTFDRIKLVKNLSACGMPESYIASELGISVKELKEGYADELALGLDDANAKVAQRLFDIATTGDDRVAITAIKYWLSVKAGWKEPAREVELSGKGGKDLYFPDRSTILNDLAGVINEPNSKID
jgi:hypothetical protein